MNSPLSVQPRQQLQYLDDIVVGSRFQTGSHTVTADEITTFARQFDPQPFHIDEEAAKATFFGGLAASGWHTAAITMRLLVEGPVRPADGIIGAGVDVSWPAPTRAGDTLTVYSEVIELKTSSSRPERGLMTLRSETRNQRGQVVQVQTSKLVVFRRPVAQGEQQS
jgi:acyl dehydratase